MSAAEPLASPRLVVVPAAGFGAAAADLVAQTLAARGDAVLGLPTGNTPIPLYQELLRRAAAGEANLSRARVAMLDEYLDAGTVSFRGWLEDHFLRAAGVGPERLLAMPSRPENIAAACVHYEEQLAAWGGCDLQLLGLGHNGHIGFNEPGSEADSRTRVVRLSEQTRRANEEYWPGREIPARGVTTGLALLLAARRILLLVRGEDKAAILERTLRGPISSAVPASFLRRAADVWVVADEAAAGRL